MDSLGAQFVGGPGYGWVCVHGISISHPLKSENWKPGILPRDDVLEIVPEWRRLHRHGMPEPKRLEKLRIRRSGVVSRAGGLRAVREIPGAGWAGRQNFRVSVFREADVRDSIPERVVSARSSRSDRSLRRQNSAKSDQNV